MFATSKLWEKLFVSTMPSIPETKLVYQLESTVLCANVQNAFSISFIVTLFARLCVRVGMLLVCRKHVHDCTISLRGDVWSHKTRLSPNFLLKCMYQANKTNSHVFVYYEYRYFCWNLEKFWQCGTFVFCFFSNIFGFINSLKLVIWYFELSTKSCHWFVISYFISMIDSCLILC